jgi:hypothetical protein
MDQQLKDLLSQGFAAVLGSTAAFLTVWKATLSAERAAQLADLERRGLRLGVSVNMPKDRNIVQDFMLDPNGETEVATTRSSNSTRLRCVN